MPGWLSSLLIYAVIWVIIQWITTPKGGAPEDPLVTEHLTWLKEHPEYSPRGGDHTL